MRVSIVNTVFVRNDFCQLVLKFYATKEKNVVSKTTSCIMLYCLCSLREEENNSKMQGK